MNRNNSTEEFLARILCLLAKYFHNQLILKGGMLLRLLDSPRKTQDLDYCWIRTKKRTLFGEEIKNALEKIEGLKVMNIHANSRGVFITAQETPSHALAKIEISVVSATHKSPKPMSTAPLTNRYDLGAHIISTMDLSEALSHKIAASLERRLIRDLYDISQLEPLANFDLETLKDRLGRLEIRRAKPRKVNLGEAAELLRKRLDDLTQEAIRNELQGQLPEDYLPGLEHVVRSSVLRTIQKISAHGE